MRGIESRLAKIERTMQPPVKVVDEAFERKRAAWRAAGGPMSIVCGATRADAEALETTLRACGMIQAADHVTLLPMRPEYEKPFIRHCIFDEDWGPTKRDRLKAAMAEARSKPPLPRPPGW